MHVRSKSVVFNVVTRSDFSSAPDVSLDVNILSHVKRRPHKSRLALTLLNTAGMNIKNFSAHENLQHNMLKSKRKQILSDLREKHRCYSQYNAFHSTVSSPIKQHIKSCKHTGAFVCILLLLKHNKWNSCSK